MTVLSEVEDKRWPFVVSVIPPNPDEAFFERYFVKQLEIMARKEQWVHLVDVRAVNKLPNARVRTLLARFTKEAAEPSRLYNVGTALVMASTLARGVLTAIHWLSPPAYPFESMATPEAGVEYLRSRLLIANLPVPPGMSSNLVELVSGRVLGERKSGT
jgi:hypothetical protein